MIDSHKKTVNDDEDFPFKYWTHTEFKRRFGKDDLSVALEYAAGVSTIWSNYLKSLSQKFHCHIKPLIGFDFKEHKDGGWRIHLHSVLRADKKIVCRKAEKMWVVGRGWNAFKLYKPELDGVAYIMRGHKSLYWEYPSCPRRKRTCKGKKGCIHKRRTGNDLLH